MRLTKRRTETVTPEMGLLDDPRRPAIYPAIADATKATNKRRAAINAERARRSESQVYKRNMGITMRAMAKKTFL